VEETLNLPKCLLCLTARRGPQRVLLDPAMAPTGTTDGGGGRVLEADGVMVQGLAGLPMGLERALAMVLVLALAQARARGLATALGVVVVLMVLELVLEVAARVATRITHRLSPRTKATMAECMYWPVRCCIYGL
jgi:hypothetical protein